MHILRFLSLRPIPTLNPLAVVSDCNQYKCAIANSVFQDIQREEATLIEKKAYKKNSFTIKGFCILCSRSVRFLIDKKSGGIDLGQGKWQPNLRERLVCPACGLNNRQRLVATLLKQYVTQDASKFKKIYFMEQVTPIFNWANSSLAHCSIYGSEYLGTEFESGQVINGIRHEDVTQLSFEDNSMDMIVSNDVLEHVPNVALAFKECARILKSGGKLIATFPFHANLMQSQTRAILKNKITEHLLPPIFHGNPISSEGSLVFTDFGWDVLELISNAGFTDVKMEIYNNKKLGHLGTSEQIVFQATAI